MKQLNNGIIKVLKYFSFFAYQPTLDEIYTFLPKKISKTKLEIELKRLKYTPVEYSMLSQNSKVKSQKLKSKIKNNNEAMKQWNNLNDRKQISKAKLNSPKFKLYIKLLSLFPQIRLVGLSGSISMMNAKEDDDIDLFIITAKNRLFTGRLITLILAQLLGLRRHRQTEKLDTVFFDRLTPKGPQAIVSKKISSLSSNNETIKQSNYNFHDKVCLNLFFDESNLKVPKFKQTEFVGHEVLQMKPIIAKGNVYERFLAANRWVFRIFPNAALPVIPAKAGIQTKSTGSSTRSGMTSHFLIFDFVETILKKFQLRLINKHKTTEIITPTQLWFHPDDFEKKLKLK